MPRSIAAVRSLLEQEVHRLVRQAQIDLAAGYPLQPKFEPLDLNVEYLSQLRWRQGMKYEDFVEPVEKFRGKPLSSCIHGNRGQIFLFVADIVHKTNRSISRPLHF